MKYRTEKDHNGEVNIPIDAYYGIKTARSKEKYSITGQRIHKQMIKALALVKKATAFGNYKVRKIDLDVADAIMLSCDDIVNGRLIKHFITDTIQGGSGAAMHNNINEIIANRANEILGGEKGQYNFVDPTNHVSLNQSANDIVQTAGKAAAIKLTKKLIKEMKKLDKTLMDKSEEFRDIVKMGRTHLIDAAPIRLGDVFASYAYPIERDIKRLEQSISDLLVVNLGASLIPSDMEEKKDYIDFSIKKLNELTKLQFKTPENYLESTINLDSFLTLSNNLQSISIHLSKVANDLRMMHSLKEISLPELNDGDINLPGKTNPIIPEVVNQVAFEVIGNTLTISLAIEAGQLELNAFVPIILANVFFSIDILRHGIEAFHQNAIKDIVANKEFCLEYIERSSGLVSILSPYLGYDKIIEIAHQSQNKNIPLREYIIQNGYMEQTELDEIIQLKNKIKK